MIIFSLLLFQICGFATASNGLIESVNNYNASGHLTHMAAERDVFTSETAKDGTQFWETSDEERPGDETSIMDTDDFANDDDDGVVEAGDMDELKRLLKTLTKALESKDANTTVGEKCSRTTGSWREIFRFSSSSKGVVHNAWKTVFDHSVNTSWDKSNRVRFTMRNRETSHYIIFNTTDTGRENWFTPSRIVATSYVDLTNSHHNAFAIRGRLSTWGSKNDTGHSRSFFVNKLYRGCHGDYGWFVVVDGDTDHRLRVCPWERRVAGSGSKNWWPGFRRTQRRTTRRNGVRVSRREPRDQTGVVEKGAVKVQEPILLFCPGVTGCLWSKAAVADELLIEMFI